MNRRQLLSWIGKTAGVSAMYQAMSSLGFAAESRPMSHLNFSGAPKGASVLILGAGLAGMAAAYELSQAGYKVKILEYNGRAGGRCWTLRGGDTFTELGGEKQTCEFSDGNYINPGPWRIPHDHHHVMEYCNKFGVALEPFCQLNYNAYLHSTQAFDGKPQRYRHVQADYQGYISEMLGKVVKQGALDDELTLEDRERLFESLRSFAALDENGAYKKSLETSMRRGFAIDPPGGLGPSTQYSEPLDRSALIQSELWEHIWKGQQLRHMSTIFQPVGGMDSIAKAFVQRVGQFIEYNAKVTHIDQSDTGVSATYTVNGEEKVASADWCVCTIPLSILGQIPMKVGTAMQMAIRAVPYDASIKIGLEFKRRFWEQDDTIYGGLSYTDLPISQISYPSSNFGSKGAGVLLGAYTYGPNAYEFTSLPPAQRIKQAVKYGAQIHPQYTEEFANGISVGWHRVPWTLGCYGMWTEETRKAHYENLCNIDGRIVLAGEHASYLPAWQEGALSSARDAIQRLHNEIVSTGA
ncbi:flavin monoamine oxidase family protein [Alteromonas sp. C1M14]|uniref:flavin monoamine oxidase family protein n=1 Tax=Alteromonas sp. C1M14 TaxID=2841567 RepID=UPI001C095C72|nr:flavin monoamine oxidase family protein [Alteromonas sp. C1M14]MBU2979703.1 flavin monoamine oxidase family protein [Alteromonas sp. C1M14]